MCGATTVRTVARMSRRTEHHDRRNGPGQRAPGATRLGRLAGWAADHRRLLVIAWGVAILGLGALAPFADRALSGAGWEARGSESAVARDAIERRFPGQGTYALPVVVAGR